MLTLIVCVCVCVCVCACVLCASFFQLIIIHGDRAFVP